MFQDFWTAWTNLNVYMHQGIIQNRVIDHNAHVHLPGSTGSPSTGFTIARIRIRVWVRVRVRVKVSIWDPGNSEPPGAMDLWCTDSKFHTTCTSGTEKRGFSMPLLTTWSFWGWCRRTNLPKSKLNTELYIFRCTGHQSSQDNRLN